MNKNNYANGKNIEEFLLFKFYGLYAPNNAAKHCSKYTNYLPLNHINLCIFLRNVWAIYCAAVATQCVIDFC